MAGVERKAFGFALTADADSTGQVTVASTTNVWEGAQCWISSTTEASKLCEVVEVVDSAHLRLKILHQPGESYVGFGPNYGASDLSIYDLADTARLDFPQQLRILKNTEN